MPTQLRVSIGQFSDRGRKTTNQDAHGSCIPPEPLCSLKGICIALADGISSSNVSQVASQTAVSSFLEDYYCTSEAWSVQTSAERVLGATNSWLHAQTLSSEFRYEKDKGYVCTFSALVLKSTTAHIFHVGDARIYRLQAHALEQLTEDHRVGLSAGKNFLSRALGIGPRLDLDYLTLPMERGTIFLLATDGVYEHLSEPSIVEAISAYGDDLDGAAKEIASLAHDQGSPDNLTVQVVRVEELPDRNPGELLREFSALPFPPSLAPRMQFDGYTITRELYASHRSHVYLAQDDETKAQMVIKVPAVDMRDNEAQLERFVMEEWVGRRISSAHVLRHCEQTRPRNFVYLVTEYVDGQTLKQWMLDHPKPGIEAVRGIVEQIALGMHAFHRRDMLHQDLRPENILIDGSGTVRIIDFGSVQVAGIAEIDGRVEQLGIWGTEQYAAPEYFLGESGSMLSDQFSLGVIAYQMLSGKLPYGAQVAKCRTKQAQRRLVYQSVLDESRDTPAWVDEAIAKAVHPNPERRYAELSEFIYDLRYPNQEFLIKTRPPLLERNPAVFWKGVSVVLAIIIVLLLVRFL